MLSSSLNVFRSCTFCNKVARNELLVQSKWDSEHSETYGLILKTLKRFFKGKQKVSGTSESLRRFIYWKPSKVSEKTSRFRKAGNLWGFRFCQYIKRFEVPETFSGFQGSVQMLENPFWLVLEKTLIFLECLQIRIPLLCHCCIFWTD